MIPILFLLIGAVIGDRIALILNYDQSISSVIVGSFFLFIAYLFIKLKGKGLSKKEEYQPKIIRILKR